MKPKKLFCQDCQKEIGYAIIGTTQAQEKHQERFPDHKSFSEI